MLEFQISFLFLFLKAMPFVKETDFQCSYFMNKSNSTIE